LLESRGVEPGGVGQMRLIEIHDLDGVAPAGAGK
jgi:hypothetical protein